MYVNAYQTFAINSIINEGWQADLLKKARAGTSAEVKADTNEHENEEEKGDKTCLHFLPEQLLATYVHIELHSIATPALSHRPPFLETI